MLWTKKADSEAKCLGMRTGSFAFQPWGFMQVTWPPRASVPLAVSWDPNSHYPLQWL